MDKYQERYIQHQQVKKQILIDAIRKRHSDRVFSDKPIDEKTIGQIIDSANYAPSSCNRKAVELNFVKFRDNKALLGGILVGGVGWVHRADTIILLVANKEAYKENLDYMPYLDAGFMAQNIWLTCTILGVGCCFVNPNIRDENKFILYDRFIKDHQILCGALALGYTEPEKEKLMSKLEWPDD